MAAARSMAETAVARERRTSLLAGERRPSTRWASCTCIIAAVNGWLIS